MQEKITSIQEDEAAFTSKAFNHNAVHKQVAPRLHNNLPKASL